MQTNTNTNLGKHGLFTSRRARWTGRRRRWATLRPATAT